MKLITIFIMTDIVSIYIRHNTNRTRIEPCTSSTTFYVLTIKIIIFFYYFLKIYLNVININEAKLYFIANSLTWIYFTSY